jgi:phage shock protein PspC (stress-responsive transcriptional regulator)
MPTDSGIDTVNQEREEAMNWNLREMRKSAQDKKIAGVCGGFGEYIPVPSWLWRVAFLTSLFMGGIGLIAYLILWITMPSAKADR